MREVRQDMPELAYLLEKVEKKYGRRIATTTDFEALSVVIEHHTGELLSSSTLKRLWGYVSLNPTPRVATLDILSRFIGHKNFKNFCESLKSSEKCQALALLIPGVFVTIGLIPDKSVNLKYHGDYQFEVISEISTQFLLGDRLEISEIMIGNPLHIMKIYRGCVELQECRTFESISSIEIKF